VGAGEFAIVVGGVMMGILVMVMLELAFGFSCGREVAWWSELRERVGVYISTLVTG
jgi:hypothetical protein